MTLGPVITEIMSRKFAAVTDEMTTNLKRASRSVYVKEAGDFGVGLADLEGHIFAFHHRPVSARSSGPAAPVFVPPGCWNLAMSSSATTPTGPKVWRRICPICI